MKYQLKAELKLDDFQLNAQEGYLISRLHSPRSFDELLHETPFTDDELQTILDKLCQTGLLLQSDHSITTVTSQRQDDRAYYEQELRKQSLKDRIYGARRADVSLLRAYCFDQSIEVLQAVFQNENFGMAHARSIARYHRHPNGLEFLIQHPALLRDAAIFRALLLQPSLSEKLFDALMRLRTLSDSFLLLQSRERSERVSSMAKNYFIRRFRNSDAELRLQLILKTEGRCLQHLHTVNCDTALTLKLCSRPIHNETLAIGLARWRGLSRKVAQHILNQARFSQHAYLIKLLQKHRS